MVNETVVTWRPWVDHNYPNDFRFTLPFRSGAALQSVVAAFITSIVFPAIWTIVAFALHQLQASSSQQPVDQRLTRVFLRNHSTPAWVMWKSLRLFADRDLGNLRQRVTRPAVLRSFYICAIAVTLIACTIAAAVESAKISTGIDDYILLRSSNCGVWDSKDLLERTVQSNIAFGNTVRTQVLAASAYANTCYGTSMEGPTCSRFVVRQLPWTANKNATCPFKSGTCIGGDTAAFEMTTPLLDSNDHFGINAPLHQRVQIQKKTTCSPMQRAKYVDVINGTHEGEQILLYYYGNLTSQGETTNTLNISRFASQYQEGYVLNNWQGSMSFANGTSTRSSVQAAPDFVRTDADPSFFFLQAKAMLFSGPSDDPMFSAHFRTYNDTIIGDVYAADFPATVLGCADQFRICNPNNQVCTSFNGLTGLALELVDFYKSGKIPDRVQASTANVLKHAMDTSLMTWAVNGRDAQALQALNNVYMNFQYPLPNNQWHIEVGSWFNVVLAKMQLEIYNFARGPDDSVASFINVTAPYDLRSCDVKVHAAGAYKTFSGTGVCLIFVLGGALWVVSWFFDILVGFVQQSLGRGAERKREWDADSNSALLIALMGKYSGSPASQDTGYKGYQMVGKKHESVLSEEEVHDVKERIAPVSPVYDDPPKGVLQ